MIREGDLVKIKTAKEEIEGVLMPSSETDVVVVKLSNGYNVGIDKNKIRIVFCNISILHLWEYRFLL